MGFRKPPAPEILLDGLNAGQREAVTTTEGPLLVLSGAGTGKTRVLVSRIGWLMARGIAEPERIMAVTFTTKAAAEMRHRLATLRLSGTRNLALGTFHALWRRFLMDRPEIAGLKPDFKIADVSHQRRILKSVAKGLFLDADAQEAREALRTLAGHIDMFKGRGLRPEDVTVALKMLTDDEEKREGRSGEYCISPRPPRRDLTEGNPAALSAVEEGGRFVSPGTGEHEAATLSQPSARTEGSGIATNDGGVLTNAGGAGGDHLPPVLSSSVSSFTSSSLTGLPFASFADLPLLLAEAALIYPAYQNALRVENLADFNDLMLWPTLAMRADEGLRRRWAGRFTHILIDEFQDTSLFQWEAVRMLAVDHENLCAVGDEDQSIYGFRLAEVENILGFTDEYPRARIVRLEDNYRCSATILAAANAVISHNVLRLGKVLRTGNPAGERIVLAECGGDRGEAEFIAGEIGHLRDITSPDEIAVLYRSNYLSRGLQERLLAGCVPHEVVGDAGFYERSEILDALSYLRLVGDRDDDEAFERVCNRPARGVGETTLESIRVFAGASGLSLFAAAEAAANRSLAEAPKIRADAIAGMRDLIAVLGAAAALVDDGAGAAEVLAAVIDGVGYGAWLKAHDGGGADAIENLEELMVAAGRWPSPGAFLEFVDRLSRNREATEGAAQRVKLMTLHRSKGLEFDHVFLIGWEEGVFPSDKAIGEGDDPGSRAVEEERRLAYVGLTRGRRRVVISRCRRRGWDRKEKEASRFAGEIPEELLDRRVLAGAGEMPGSVTAKQIAFCGLIAKRLKIGPPDFGSLEAVRAFLEENVQKFRAL